MHSNQSKLDDLMPMMDKINGIKSHYTKMDHELCKLTKNIEKMDKVNMKKAKCKKCMMPKITRCRNKEDDFCKAVIKKACYDYNKPYCWSNCCVWPIKY
jgi:hypothetical protein